MLEERWEHSGKWLFPARLHHIRIGNGRKKSVCVRVCVCVCVCLYQTNWGSAKGCSDTESTTVSHNPLIVFLNGGKSHPLHMARYTELKLNNPPHGFIGIFLNCSMSCCHREFIMWLWLTFMGPIPVLYSLARQGLCTPVPLEAVPPEASS